MTNVRKINYRKIYIFDENQKAKGLNNSLKEFLYYLKFKGHSGVIDFTYSCEKDSLHKNMSIKENFILDSIPTSFIRDEENNLNEFLRSIENQPLVSLIESLGNLNLKINQLSNEKLKLTSIIKALLSDSEYVFLVRPEDYLDNKTINILKSCIENEVEQHSRKFFIKPRNRDIWMDISTHIISKCEKSLTFIDYPNPLSKLKTVNDFKPTYNFTLHKKAG